MDLTKLCGWRLAIDVEPVEDKTESGIIVHRDEIKKRATDKGVVLAIGELAWKDPKFGGCEPWCEVGDRILFVRYAGNQQENELTGMKYTLINDEDVMGVLPKKEQVNG